MSPSQSLLLSLDPMDEEDENNVKMAKAMRRVSYFVVSLSVASILAILEQIPGVLDFYGLVHLRGELLCGVMGFIRNFPSVVIPLSVVGDTWYSTRKPVPERGRSAAVRVLALTWLVASTSLFPICFMYSYDDTSSEQRPICKKISLLGSHGITVAYYWQRFIIYHLLTVLYLFYAFYQTKSRINAPLFGPNTPVSLQKGVARLRLIFFYDMMFAFVWFPVGLLFAVQFTVSKEKQIVFRPFTTQRTILDFPLGDLVTFILFLFISLHPPIFYLTHVGVSKNDFYKSLLPNRLPNWYSENNQV